MIKDFFMKKENIFISVVAVISIFCVVLGFLFLFFGSTQKDGPRTIPNSVSEIQWDDFSSKILDKKIKYPEYLYVSEQKEESGVGVTFAEFEPSEFLTYFSNQSHFSIYPAGVDSTLFYGKSRQSDFTSSSGQEYVQTEYLTVGNQVWGVKLVPKVMPKGWQQNGFIWIQADIKNRSESCIDAAGKVFASNGCDPYANELPVYQGEIRGQFIRFGYEIVNKNTF